MRVKGLSKAQERSGDGQICTGKVKSLGDHHLLGSSLQREKEGEVTVSLQSAGLMLILSLLQ